MQIPTVLAANGGSTLSSVNSDSLPSLIITVGTPPFW